jgi:hypothetical protein
MVHVPGRTPYRMKGRVCSPRTGRPPTSPIYVVLRAAQNVTWELSGPCIVTIEHAEQMREDEAPTGAGDTTRGGSAMEQAPGDPSP